MSYIVHQQFDKTDSQYIENTIQKHVLKEHQQVFGINTGGADYFNFYEYTQFGPLLPSISDDY